MSKTESPTVPVSSIPSGNFSATAGVILPLIVSTSSDSGAPGGSGIASLPSTFPAASVVTDSLDDCAHGFSRLRKKALLDRQRSDFLCAKRKERPMRGKDRQRGHLGGYVNPEARIPQDHPLRQIRPLVDAALTRLSPLFDELYSPIGRPSRS